MYFPNDRLRKTWLDKSLKHAASEDPSTVKVCTATTLSYLSIPVKPIELVKVSLSNIKTLRLLVNTLTAHDKNSLLNMENLMEPIHMQLSKKEKIFS